MMDGQMTIFDFLEPAEKSLDDYTEAEMVEGISKATRIGFTHEGGLSGWVFKKGKYHLDVHFSNYSIGAGERFIACGWGNSIEGGGSPCDSIDQAVRFFKRVLERMKKAK